MHRLIALRPVAFRRVALAAAAALATLLAPGEASAARVKDVATVYGVRDNALVGWGIVTGLSRTGDSIMNEATVMAYVARLQGLGFNVSVQDIFARNVAAVMVTARLPSTARPGQKLDVEVSSAGDAMSLEGGVLQLTPLFAPNGEAFATAQGPVVVGGFVAAQAGNVARKNHTTTGRVPQGAIVERDNPNRLAVESLETVDLLLNEPDFTTAQRLAEAVNDTFDEPLARPRDPSTVTLKIPPRYLDRTVEFLAEVERVELTVDRAARIVVNERTGTVVMGGDVKIASVAVAHGGLSIEVAQENQVSQPAPLSAGRTVAVAQTQIKVKEAEGDLVVVNGVTIGDLVNALNNMGVKPRDLVQILLAIHAAGALEGTVEVM